MSHGRTFLARVLVATAAVAATSLTAAMAVAPAQASPPSNGPGVESYVAIGDSYTAGFGIPTWEYDGGCYRSDRDYPKLLAKKLDVSDLRDVSCTGATPSDTVQAQFAAVPAQFDALDAGTDLVTIGLGANYGQIFGGLVSGCPSVRHLDPTGHPCEDIANSSGTDAFYTLTDEAGVAVGTVIAGVHDRAPNARVVIVGYPRLAPDHGTCAALPLANGDYAYVNSVLERLDDNLQQAAAANDADYIDLWGASRGHDICSNQAWVQGSVNTNHQAAPYHPFEAEQQAVADLIAALVQPSGPGAGAHGRR